MKTIQTPFLKIAAVLMFSFIAVSASAIPNYNQITFNNEQRAKNVEKLQLLRQDKSAKSWNRQLQAQVHKDIKLALKSKKLNLPSFD